MMSVMADCPAWSRVIATRFMSAVSVELSLNVKVTVLSLNVSFVKSLEILVPSMTVVTVLSAEAVEATASIPSPKTNLKDFMVK